jgi:hypothetical protein
MVAISPYRETRRQLRERIGSFLEVYVNAPIETCIQRDPKRLYERALAGEIRNFTGIDDPTSLRLSQMCSAIPIARPAMRVRLRCWLPSAKHCNEVQPF